MHSAVELAERPKVLLIGSPNAGKTTLFNWITGSKYRAVNYPGATVEYCAGASLPVYGSSLDVVDTPGIYSLFPKSPEEEISVKALFESHGARVVVLVADLTQVARHLVLLEQLREAGFAIVIAATMDDLLVADGRSADVAKLSRELMFPVVKVDGRLGGGVKELVGVVRDVLAKTTEARKPAQPSPWTREKSENTLARLDKIASLVVTSSVQTGPSTTERLDRFVLHPVWGLFIFAGLMTALFSAIFWAAAPLMDLVDGGFGWLADAARNNLGEGLLTRFVADGIIAGLGSVLVFLPQIFILFLGLVFLEDWGYLARAASIVDRPLSKLGLNGRSFVPLLSGYACAIPAMMAARTMNSRKERLLTLFVIPLMSCSARLPVFALLLAFVLKDSPAWVGGVAMTGIYALSIVIGAVASLIAGKFLGSEQEGWFLMELPVFRSPRLKHVFVAALKRTFSYVRGAGPMILTFSLIIWVGTTFPDYNNSDDAARLEASYAAKLGQFIEPAMEPMGADWRVGVGLISAFAAREVFVSAMAVIFHITDVEDDSLQESLLGAMHEAKTASGAPLFTFASVAGLVLFFIIALQCLSTVAVARRESGSLKFTLVQLASFTIAAYVLTVALVQGLRAVGVA